MFTDLIGKPFEYCGKSTSFDCWTLAQEIARRVGGRLPDQSTVVELGERARKIKEVFDEFIKLERPEPFCLVLFWLTHRNVPEHIGTILNNRSRFIHVTKDTGVAISEIDHPFWRIRVVGYYAYNTTKLA